MSNELSETQDNALLGDLPKPFYVVSFSKFLWLFIGTFGTYELFWVRCHWLQQKLLTGEPMQPFWRGVFDIFWIRSLFRTIDETRNSKNIEYSWSWSALSALFIAVIILDRSTTRLSWNSSIDWRVTNMFYLLGFVFLALRGWIMWQAQKLANLVSGDPKGSSNTKLVWWQYIAITIMGALVLLSTCVVIYELIAGAPLPS